MAKVKVNGIELEYKQAMPKKGVAPAGDLLLITGLGCQLLHWPPGLIRQFSNLGFRVTYFDNRDMGLSTHLYHLPPIRHSTFDMARWLAGACLPAHYSLQDMADDALGLADALGIERFHVAGVSMGGMITQLLAIGEPRRVISATSIMSTSGNRRVGYPSRGAMKKMSARPLSATDEALAEFGADLWLSLQGKVYTTPREELLPFIAAVVKRAKSPTGYFRQLQAVTNAPNRVADLKKCHVPMLVLHGDDDPLIHVSGGRSVAKAAANSRLTIIEGWGHDLPAALHDRIASEISQHATAAN